MRVKTAIEAKLTAAFAPESLAVSDESHLHAGHHHDTSHHAPFTGGGETHFRVSIVSAAFAGRSRVERHRAVNEVLRDELAGSVHALAIEARAPAEPARQKG